MKTYEITAKSITGTLCYKGEGFGKSRNFSDNGSRENEEFNNQEDAVSTARSMLNEFDKYTTMEVTESLFEEIDGELEFTGSKVVWSEQCTGA